MRYFVLLAGLTGAAWAQTITEFGAAAAGGAAGGAAGKKVSDGLTSVLGKVDQQVNTAAKQGKTAAKPAAAVEASAAAGGDDAPAAQKPAPAKKAAPRANREPVRDPSSVPPPPPIQRAGVTIKRPPAVETVVEVAPPPPPPPAPQISREDLTTLALGTARADVLKLGVPASRVMWVDGSGHLVEIYHYIANNATMGVVNLSDGAVAGVQLR